MTAQMCRLGGASAYHPCNKNHLHPLCTNEFFLLVNVKKTLDGPLYILRFLNKFYSFPED